MSGVNSTAPYAYGYYPGHAAYSAASATASTAAIVPPPAPQPTVAPHFSHGQVNPIGPTEEKKSLFSLEGLKSIGRSLKNVAYGATIGFAKHFVKQLFCDDKGQFSGKRH